MGVSHDELSRDLVTLCVNRRAQKEQSKPLVLDHGIRRPRINQRSRRLDQQCTRAAAATAVAAAAAACSAGAGAVATQGKCKGKMLSRVDLMLQKNKMKEAKLQQMRDQARTTPRSATSAQGARTHGRARW